MNNEEGGDFDEYISRIDIMEITAESANSKACVNQFLFQEMGSKARFCPLTKKKEKCGVICMDLQ